MTADDFRATLADFSLTQQACGRLFDVDERTVRRWSTGAVAVPRSVMLVFALMKRFRLGVGDL